MSMVRFIVALATGAALTSPGCKPDDSRRAASPPAYPLCGPQCRQEIARCVDIELPEGSELSVHRAICSSGAPDTSCVSLANAYREGSGVPRDSACAEALYRGACQDDTASMLMSCSFDPDLAMRSFREGCDREIWKACFSLANAILLGIDDGEPRPREAIEVLERGCAGGREAACRALGAWFVSCNLEPDHPRRTEHLRRACQLGYAPACDASRDCS